MPLTLTAGADDNDRRLDRILRKALPTLSLPFIYRLLRTKAVWVDGKPACASFRVKAGCTITIVKGAITSPLLRPLPEPVQPLSAELEVLWEGDGLLAVNKPAGVDVHGPHGLDKVIGGYLMPRLKERSLSFKPGPLHRLDKPTSGVLIFSTTLEGAQRFSAFLRKRLVHKRYFAIVEGVVKSSELWQDRLVRDKAAGISRIAGAEGSLAITRIFPVGAYGALSCIIAEPETGRTHQIRVQAAAHGHPLAGDSKYGAHFCTEGLFLHAFSLQFPGLERPIIAKPPSSFKKKVLLMGLDLNLFLKEPQASLL
ncbi:MAG: RluA family pseudouridine synthase [Spirochaetaceae bacterium]|jgi:23S rRNA pseudouridine955/2504/2580 synthase|nr:RluA family pseudouridine synthase [Spirochaetaceae bacterium]